ncbi:MAG: 2-amino-4-hydroxy-6-hydroxymethyldihydropteridine diphosphokinase [Bosea sp. 12-68-7]|nr:MAG: 2-amino-4-hydroxy-6-hydroxymethyldihydropteridine diphosphokinase [Bosea sp. 12-68-7]OYX03183.1 MAG: 2-amino-4-hydroxy-6-hydroxymethyldihydropteridine diphosphokinase [Bosea sp. 32-68-6]
MRVEAALGLGGNLGDPVVAFATVLRRLEAHQAVSLVRPSSVYRTAPWGKVDQPEFLNMAVLLETGLSARALLDLCLFLEREGGRERRERWGPRTLDIDILTYGGQTIDEPGLQVPHPRIAERAFVLAPLAEIAPGMMIGGRSVTDLVEAVIDATIRRDPAATERLRALPAV